MRYDYKNGSGALKPCPLSCVPLVASQPSWSGKAKNRPPDSCAKAVFLNPLSPFADVDSFSCNNLAE